MLRDGCGQRGLISAIRRALHRGQHCGRSCRWSYLTQSLLSDSAVPQAVILLGYRQIINPSMQKTRFVRATSRINLKMRNILPMVAQHGYSKNYTESSICVRLLGTDSDDRAINLVCVGCVALGQSSCTSKITYLRHASTR